MEIRAAQPGDINAISELIRGLAKKYIVDDFSALGKDTLLRSMSPEAVRTCIQSGYVYHVAETDKRVVAVIAVKENRHLFHLFVAEEYQRQGIAKKLWELAMNVCLSHGNPGEFTVNSSIYARPVYEKLGFVTQSEPQEKMGVVFIPMKLMTECRHARVTR